MEYNEKTDLLNYLKRIGFEDRVKPLSREDFALQFENELDIREGIIVTGLSSKGKVIKVDIEEAPSERLYEMEEEIQVRVFEELESGNWDFL